ncbi:glycosyltransferase [Kribbella sp. NBC_01505]|uniref:glycosyltransferase n=1 Tax=Kribbella sp. NBC_01505 TaxID=2903580 RepID=UPI0038635674
MRFLLVVPPLTGHVTPLRAVAAELRANGHEVAWCGPEPTTSELVGEPVYPAGDARPFAVELRPAELRGFAALKYLWQNYLIPLADEMVPGVRAAVEDFAPHVVVADQQAFAGAVVATELGIPWATSASTSTELAEPAFPKIAAWITGLLYELCRRYDVPELDLRFSPHLILAFTTRELAGPPAPDLAVQYVGAPVTDPPKVDFPWDRLDERPLVVITLGTANAAAGRRFVSEGVAALASMREVQGVVAGDVPSDDVIVADRIPQVELLRRAAVVVCHGGQNTVSESLRAGVPLVVAPIRDDQSMLAQQVVATGAGVRVRFDRASAEDLRAAITSLLIHPQYVHNAARIQQSYLAAGGAARAAQLLCSVKASLFVERGQPCNPMSR